MKKQQYLFLFILMLVFLQVKAQLTPETLYLDSLYEATPNWLLEKDEQFLKSVPVLSIDQSRLNQPIPSYVNNAESYFFPYMFYQVALECAQSSSLTYLFSYELAVRRNRYLLFDTPYNKYHIPSHFAWNFCNSGTNRGVSFMDTWQVIRTAGSPFTPDWGTSYSDGGEKKWLSGYDKYYRGMQNRIVEMYAIPTHTEEGINTLRHWIANHCSDDARGGCANFYCRHQSPNGVLPPGTPEAGKAVMVEFSTSVNHSETIVGYNDSIRYDYNGDGIYTNHLDINGDGIVDVRDWEIGGVIICNTFGPTWGDNGFCYLPYKKLAETHSENAGIWNACVYVVQVRDEVFPQLTYKVTIKHNKRSQIRLRAGINPDLNANAPSKTIDFNVFNFQGGENYMQGGTTEADKTLELGLDITPLLNDIEPNIPYLFFLEVTESDPNGTGSGQIVSFSLIDYTNGGEEEISHPSQNTPIANNSTTYLTVQRAVNFTKPTILTNEVETAAFEEFEIPLQASGGVEPYRWEFTQEYEIEEFNAPYPPHQGVQVPLSNFDNGFTRIELPFTFPCFENQYSEIYVYADGYITFKNNTYNWPFLIDADYQVKTTRFIAPFRADLVITSLLKESTAHSLKLSFVGQIKGQVSQSVQFTLQLFDDGTIEFYYGNMSYSGNKFLSVLSRGDVNHFQETPVSQTAASQCSGRNFRLTPPPKIDQIQITRDGRLKGRLEVAMEPTPLAVTCFDNNEVKTNKIINFSSLYGSSLLITNITVNGPAGTTIRAGDTISLSVSIKNVDQIGLEQSILQFSSADHLVHFIDSTEYFGYIAPGNEYILNNAIRFVMDPVTPDQHVLELQSLITNSSNINTEGTHHYYVHGKNIKAINYSVYDGNNNLLDPDENLNLTIKVKNNSDFDLQNLRFVLRFLEPELSVYSPPVTIESLVQDEIKAVPFLVSVNSNFIPGNTVDALLDIYIDNTFFKTEVVTILGYNPCLTFESGIPSYVYFPETPWSTTEISPGEGLVSAGSGMITHNQSSTLQIDRYVLVDGEITFRKKVSSETNYDFLRFYIDDELMDQWSGTQNWQEVSYPITAGYHRFSWVYVKDYSVSRGDDRAYIDAICFPDTNTYTPELESNIEQIYIEIPRKTTLDTTFILTSVTPTLALFNSSIIDTNGYPANWCNINFPNGSVNALQSKEVTLHFDSHHKEGNKRYSATLKIQVQDGNLIEIPVAMKVTSGVGIQEYSVTQRFILYPNPTDDQVTIEPLTPEYSIDRIEVYDLTGKLLSSEIVQNERASLSLADLSVGTYLVKIFSDKSHFQIVKVIKR